MIRSARRETRLADLNSQCPRLRHRLIAEISMLRFPKSSFGSSNQGMRPVERIGYHNPILGARFELASGHEMLRIGLNGFVAYVTLPDDLCGAGIFGKWWSGGIFSCSDHGPVAQRGQRHCEFLADFSECYVRYTVAFRDDSDGLCPDFLVKLYPFIANSYVWHSDSLERVGRHPRIGLIYLGIKRLDR